MRAPTKLSIAACIRVLAHPIVLLILSTLPILLWPFAPIIDAPNHLARIWLESQSQLTGVQKQAYIIDWSNTSSNYVVDMVGSWLLHIGSIRTLMTILLISMIVGPAIGVMAIAKRLYGHVSIYNSATLTAIWGQSMGSGFINYSISLAAAAWLFLFYLMTMRERGFWLSSTGRAGSIIIVYLIHPFGILFFAMLDAAVIYGANFRRTGRAHLTFIRQILTAYAIPFGVLTVYIFINSSINPVGKAYIKYGDWQSHLASLVSPFFAYHEKIEIIMILPMAFMLLMAMIKNRIAMHCGFLLAAIILMIGALAIPDFIGDGAWLTRRLPLMAILIFFLALRPRSVDSLDAITIIALTICVHCCWIDWVWWQRSGDFSDLESIAQKIPPDQKVIVARNTGIVRRWDEPGNYVHGPQYTRRHLPALLVPFSHAYIPTLFAIRGQQPLRITSAFQHLSSPSSAIPTLAELSAHRGDGGGDIYLARWECEFDYLLVLEQDATGRSKETFENARLVEQTASERLYKLDACQPAASVKRALSNETP